MGNSNSKRRPIIGGHRKLATDNSSKINESRGATDQQREGASGLGLSHPALTPMPEALKPAAMRSPALTPMPEALRNTMRSPGSGENMGRRVARRDSGYVVRLQPQAELSPMARRLVAHGRLEAVVVRLLALRESLRDGATLTQGLDGKGDAVEALTRFFTVLALNNRLVTVDVHAWDQAVRRKQSERLALVDALLEDLGWVRPHRGGWSISSGVSR